MNRKSTQDLEYVLKTTKPDGVGKFLKDYADDIVCEDRPFYAYMKERIHAKGLKKHQVFLNAQIDQKRGYRIIEEEKRTRQRDLILRICYGARFSLKETQRALTLYGMAMLYPRIARDAVLTIAFNNKIYDIEEINKMLIDHGMDPLHDKDEEKSKKSKKSKASTKTEK